MGYTAAQVKEIAVKLRAMPVVEPPPKDLTKQEVVKMLAKEIKSLQNKGYTLEQISTSLKGEGLDISTPTLKSYLQRVKSPPKSPTKKKVDPVTESNSLEIGSEVDSEVDSKVDSKKVHSGGSKPRPDSLDL
jgi:intein-encoded DNA endonuclease-like protein